MTHCNKMFRPEDAISDGREHGLCPDHLLRRHRQVPRHDRRQLLLHVVPQDLRNVASDGVVVEEEMSGTLEPIHLDELDQLDRFVKVEVQRLDADRQRGQLRQIDPTVGVSFELGELVDLDRWLRQLGLDLVGRGLADVCQGDPGDFGCL